MSEKKIVLHENVVSNDYVEGCFLHYFVYKTAWTDTEHIIEFENAKKAIDWYEENFKERCVNQGEQWAKESESTNEDALTVWRTTIEELLAQ